MNLGCPTRVRIALSPFFLLVGAMPSPAPAQEPAPGPLEPADYVIAGMDQGMDSTDVRRLLGPPDSVEVRSNEFEVGGEFRDWYYDGLAVSYGSNADLIGVVVTSAGYPTRRGLRVGDPVEQVRSRYGEPELRHEGTWTYVDPRERYSLYVVEVEVEEGRVSRIYVGRFVD